MTRLTVASRQNSERPMKLTPLLIAVVALPTVALADDFDRKVAGLPLLQDKKVQAELKVTDAQRSKMNKHADAFNVKAEAYQKQLEAQAKKDKKDVKPDPKKVDALMSELKAKVLGELTLVQLKRLRELSLQAVGVTALGDDLIAAKVGLNGDQKTKVRSVVRAGLDAANKLIAAADAAARKGIPEPKTEAEMKKAEETYNKRMEAEQKKLQPQLQKIRNDTITKALAVLNAKQNEIWKMLQGKPYAG